MTDAAILAREIAAPAGRAAGGDMPARWPVSACAIARFADAVGDANPIYVDAAAARACGHPSLVAPPAMLSAWTLPGLAQIPGVTPDDPMAPVIFRQSPPGLRPVRAEHHTARDDVSDLLAAHGYTSPAAANVRVRFDRYAVDGERLSLSPWTVERIAGLKRTSLGEAFFITASFSVGGSAEGRIGTILQTILRAKPKPSDPIERRDRPPVGGPAAPYRAAGRCVRPPDGRTPGPIMVGAALPALLVEVTPTLIVAGALAFNDYRDVHHDAGAAASQGHPAVLMNNVTSAGLASRLVTDWAGPSARLISLDLRLVRPVYAGDLMLLQGRIEAFPPWKQGRAAMVAAVGWTRSGEHLTAPIAVMLPSSD